MTGVHAKKSPSAAERFHNCAGAIPYTDHLRAGGIPLSKGPHVAAAKGSAAHHLLELCLQEWLEPRNFEGQFIAVNSEKAWMTEKRPRAPYVFEIDAAMIEGVTAVYAYVHKRWEEMHVGKIELEGRTNPLPDREDTAGTADVTIHAWPTLLELVEYKNGRFYVKLQDNKQLLAYLLGRAKEADFIYDEYAITVIQPNAPGSDAEGGGRIRTLKVTPEDLLVFEVAHRTACERVDEAETALPVMPFEEWASVYLVAGDHCGLCEAAASCPARQAWAREITNLDFDDQPCELVPLRDEITIDRAAAVARWADQLRAYIAKCEEIVSRLLLKGQEIEGFEMRRKRAHRRWREDLPPEKIVEAMVNAGYISQSDAEKLYTKPELISGPQAEKLVPKDKRKRFSDSMLVKPAGQLVLARPKDDDAQGGA